jgi:hypothetical protein
MAPVCSSFVFANSANCRRTVDNPSGDETYAPVSMGNIMAQAAVFLMTIAAARGPCHAKPFNCVNLGLVF